MPMSQSAKKISSVWHRLIGSAAAFSLEARIFHSISVGLILLTLIYVPYNLFEGLYIASVSALAISGFFFLQYYNSRFRGQAHSSAIFALAGIVLFSVNYFSNSGINGSTDLIWPAYLLLVLAISPYRQHFVWVTVYIIAFLLVHLAEYYYPFLVKHPFEPGKGEFIDRITAFPMPVIGTAIIIIFLRRSYDRERVASMEKADLLEQSNAEKNKLLSIISHDMRAPFTHIQGYLQLLSQVEINSMERLELEKELLSATDQTIEMLSNLLYWSRSQMEGVAANLVETNLLTVVNNTLEIEKALAARKEIHLSYHIDEHITVVADANMLQLVTRNIVNNAIKFTPQGGSIDIRTDVAGGECRIIVADNGKGIETDRQAILFSMESGSTFGTNNEKGVGLGLPLCKEFMERQGGYIDFESTPGKGSTFYIFIPLAAKLTPLSKSL
ncbi:MAG: histidine kinase [Bacteroidetes bacterium 43-93]|nr:HAMP domain-containing histidine kinase [Bacteroidota bacterium]OJW96709.1 MAG: histidine kinase [Bacteroidetes bacterium 43-93]